MEIQWKSIENPNVNEDGLKSNNCSFIYKYKSEIRQPIFMIFYFLERAWSRLSESSRNIKIGLGISETRSKT